MTTTPDTLFEEAEHLEAVTAKATWKPYPEYRDSGVEWLQAIPSHWTIERIKWTAVAVRNGIWGSEPDGVDDIPCVRVADFDRDQLRVNLDEPTMRAVTESERRGRVLSSGDLLLEKSGGGDLQPVGAVMLYDHDVEAVCSNFVARVVVASGFAPRFVTYLHAHLYSSRVNTRAIKQTTGIQNLDGAAYFDSRAAWPSLSEQQAIAAFLDRKTREIDELIEKKRRLIELLQEQRTALISHAVTKGLNSDAATKPSGVDWLGDVPEHWDVKPLMHLTEFGHRIMYGIVLPGPHFDDGVPIVKGGDVTPARLRRELLRCTDPEIEARYERSRLREGDLVYAIRGSIGACELVPADCAGANVTQDTAKIAPEPLLNRRWMKYAMKSAGVFAQLEQGALGATIQGINIRDLKRCKLPVPPADEQERIASHLDGVTAHLDDLLQTVEMGRARLTEYRQAMISAAVTGKIDVREEGVG